jgi:hypothetical protein
MHARVGRCALQTPRAPSSRLLPGGVGPVACRPSATVSRLLPRCACLAACCPRCALLSCCSRSVGASSWVLRGAVLPCVAVRRCRRLRRARPAAPGRAPRGSAAPHRTAPHRTGTAASPTPPPRPNAVLPPHASPAARAPRRSHRPHHILLSTAVHPTSSSSPSARSHRRRDPISPASGSPTPSHAARLARPHLVPAAV